MPPERELSLMDEIALAVERLAAALTVAQNELRGIRGKAAQLSRLTNGRDRR